MVHKRMVASNRTFLLGCFWPHGRFFRFRFLSKPNRKIVFEQTLTVSRRSIASPVGVFEVVTSTVWVQQVNSIFQVLNISPWKIVDQSYTFGPSSAYFSANSSVSTMFIIREYSYYFEHEISAELFTRRY